MTRGGMAGDEHVGSRRKGSVDCHLIKIATVCVREACARHILRTGRVLSSFPSRPDPAPTVLPLGSFPSGSNSPCSFFLITVPPPPHRTHSPLLVHTPTALYKLSHNRPQREPRAGGEVYLRLNGASMHSFDDLSCPQTDATRRLGTVNKSEIPDG